jgi:hypothetical protein
MLPLFREIERQATDTGVCIISGCGVPGGLILRTVQVDDSVSDHPNWHSAMVFVPGMTFDLMKAMRSPGRSDLLQSSG